MLSSLRPLHHRSFALVWSAALVSNIGSWMQTVAVGILVTARTGQAGWTGLVAAAAFLPIGLLSPIGGLMADRMDRRRWLLATTTGEMCFAAALTVVGTAARPDPAVITLLVFGGGAMAAVGFPAYQAMLPDLVPAVELRAAISLSSAQFNLGRVIGPALAGATIVAGGYSWAFALNAVSFAAVLVALALVRLPPPLLTATPEPLLRRLAEGARATAADPGCRLAVALISVVALTASPFIALVPAVAIKVFRSGSSGTTVLITAQGVGAVVGALALTPLVRRYGQRRVLVADLTVLCFALGGYAAAPDLAVAAAAILLVGGSYIGVLAGCNTIIQLRAAPALRGRVLGIYMMALGILYPIGSLAQGALADAVGLRAVTTAGASLLLVVVALAVARRSAVLDEEHQHLPTVG
ncbi:MFS transporter [Acidiferrimicrobium sp. IK]|uniref:MFS transporter n=1 Tax=Acidiferrimicrobium sp. IK TaxID=2871700 RepID=UPI0021CAFE30|nr:MFS transporter [Acidiferrimicrobium sp. IK]MCU4184424.1 MFS transporter [Acidiferrimicrobium sp. IK]